MYRLCIVALVLCSCKREEPTTAPAAEPEAAASTDQEPDVDGFSFQSGDKARPQDPDAGLPAFAVTTVEQARDLAEAAVSEQLDPKKQWKTSPVLPARWPSEEPKAMFLFYPMSSHPDAMDRYELFSAAWVVEVQLQDGATEITEVPKRRHLGTLIEGRPTSLERRELDMAEAALMNVLLKGDSKAGENRFWGYLKYFHEHPKIGKDIKKRRPRFVKWLKARPDHS